MNFNIFALLRSRQAAPIVEVPKAITPVEIVASVEEEGKPIEELEFTFGDMTLSKKLLFFERRFVNCILPPNPILPGRRFLLNN